MSEQLAGMPRFWGRVPTSPTKLRQRTRPFWILTVLSVIGAVVFAFLLVRMVVNSGQIPAALVSVVAWAIWGLFLYWLVSLLDVYRHVPPSTRGLLALWGAGVPPLISMAVELGLEPLFGQAGNALVTGLIEEGTKVLGVILVAVLVPVLFMRPLAGLVSGMMVGLGFSIVENIEYAVNAISTGAGADDPYGTVTAVVVQRGFVQGGGLHLVLTGLTGLGVAYFVSHRGRSRGRAWAGALVLFAIAVMFHFLWDWGAGSGLPAAFAALLVLTLNVLHFVVVAVAIIYAVRSERRWLANASVEDESIIEPDELGSLRKRRTRRRARRSVTDPSDRRQLKERQWAQIGYADAVADDAPAGETDRLAGYVHALRQPESGTTSGPARPGDIPAQREPAPSDQQHPTESSN